MFRCFSSYSLHIVSSCCFGIEIDTINDPDNEFFKQLNIAFSSTLGKNPKLMLVCKLKVDFGLFWRECF